MSGFDYGAFFGPIQPLADAIRTEDDRCWETGAAADGETHDYVLYLGCNVLRTVALAEIIGAILKEMKVDFVALGGPATCCGIIHHANGDMGVSEKITHQSFDKLSSYGAKAVLTYCPSCHSHMDYTRAETDIPFDLPYLHVTEFIVENLDKLTFRNRIERKVVFHAHGDDEQAERDSRFARAILDAIPGLEVIDASGGPEWGHDCGSQQIGRIGAEKHAALVEDLFVHAKQEGADGVTALYHSCYRNLCPQEATHGIEVVHYTQLVAEAMGLPTRVESYKRLKHASDPAAAIAEYSGTAQERGLSDGKLSRAMKAHFSPPAPD